MSFIHFSTEQRNRVKITRENQGVLPEFSLFLRQFGKLFFPTWLISIALGFLIYEWIGPLLDNGHHEFSSFFSALISAPLIQGAFLIFVCLSSVALIWIVSKIRKKLTGYILMPIIVTCIALISVFIFFASISTPVDAYLNFQNEILLLTVCTSIALCMVSFFRKNDCPQE